MEGVVQMNATQIQVLNELLIDKDFKGKAELKHLLWLNTTEPKFKVGDKIDDAEVVEVYSQKTVNEWCYKLKENSAKITYKKESEM